MVTLHPAISTKHFETADELWEASSPTKRFGFDDHIHTVYRGQADSTWPLIPSLWRNIEYVTSSEPGCGVTVKQMLDAEFISLRDFIKYCDKIGVNIPNDSREFRKEFVKGFGLGKYYNNPNLWPDEEYFGLIALAQHHGVPTRLLDWTSTVSTALYFAVSSSLAEYERWNDEKKIALWVLAKCYEDHYRHDVFVCECPGSISSHLAAQSGLFTVHYCLNNSDEMFVPYSLESMANNNFPPIFYKFTLPVYECPRLLTLCISAGFSAANIYPTADGAGKAVKDMINLRNAIQMHKEKIKSSMNLLAHL